MQSSREYPERPVLAVGGVVIRDTRVLLIRRKQPPMQNCWSIPGGIVELGETIAEAITRELREETSVEAHALELIEIYEKAIPDAAGRAQYHFVILDYLCKCDAGEIHAASDVSDVGWFSEQELHALHLSADVLRVVNKAFKMAAEGPQSPKAAH